jgi:predicted phosphodiesterase
LSRALHKPTMGRSIVFIGDSHVGNNPQHRLDKFAQGYRWRAGRPNHPGTPAMTVQIGDATENGLSSEITSYKAWRDSLGDPVQAVLGNHDIDPDGDTLTVATWETRFGVAANRAVDIPGVCRVVFCDYTISATVRATVDALMKATTLPVVLVVHYPPRDTHGPGLPPQNGTGTGTPYSATMTATSDSNVRQLARENNNLVAVIHGHTHTMPDVANFAALMDCGSGVWVAQANCSAITYVGAGPNPHTDPLIGYVLTVVGDDSVEYRAFDYGAGRWRAFTPGIKAIALARVG